jgi:hypothetical protein
MKCCAVCRLDKEESAFASDKSRPDGLARKCRECQKAYFAAYYAAHKEKICERTTQYQRANPAVQLKAKRKWEAANPERHRQSILSRHHRLYVLDVEYKLRYVIRGALRRTMDAAKRNQKGLVSSSLPYTAEMLKARIEMNFAAGMSWENHGEWHIDHKVPVARLVRRGVKSAAVINCLANLAPLWAEDNYRKGKR